MSSHPDDARNAAGSDQEAVSALNMRFYEALRAMLAGDPSGFSDVFSHSDDVIYLPAEGGLVRGYAAAAEDWRRQAEASMGGEVDVLSENIVTLGDAAVVLTRTRAVLQTPEGPRSLQVRESSVCRREVDRWWIVTHHADALRVWDETVNTS